MNEHMAVKRFNSNTFIAKKKSLLLGDICGLSQVEGAIIIFQSCSYHMRQICQNSMK